MLLTSADKFETSRVVVRCVQGFRICRTSPRCCHDVFWRRHVRPPPPPPVRNRSFCFFGSSAWYLIKISAALEFVLLALHGDDVGLINCNVTFSLLQIPRCINITTIYIKSQIISPCIPTVVLDVPCVGRSSWNSSITSWSRRAHRSRFPFPDRLTTHARRDDHQSRDRCDYCIRCEWRHRKGSTGEQELVRVPRSPSFCLSRICITLRVTEQLSFWKIMNSPEQHLPLV